MMTKSIHIDDHVWEITFTMNKEIQFSYVTTHVANTHPIWNDWDGSDVGDTYSTYEFGDMTIPQDVSPIKVISKILSGVKSLIKHSRTDFFYFNASTERKGRFYTNVIEKLIREIEGEWEYQIIDNSWYYISKVSE